MNKQIIVVGGGVVGLATAYFAARRGHSVCVVERGGPAQESASCGNMGMVVPSHFVPLAAPGMVALGLKWMWNPASPFYIKPRANRELWDWAFKFWRAANARHVLRSAPLLRDLHLASRACFEEFAARGGEFGLVKKGLLMLCKTSHGFEEEAKTARQARELGIPAEILDLAQAQALEPRVRLDVAGAVYFPKDCHLSPGEFMAFLRRELEGLGVEFRWNTEILGWQTSASLVRAARTRQGEIQGDEFALCAGSWSSLLARQLGLKLPLQAGKGYSLTLEHPPRLPELCAILSEARVAVTPMSGALRIGGTMEIAGLSDSINPVRVRGIIDALPKYLPEFTAQDFAGVQPWSGLRPCSPDGLPYLGRTARYSNLAIATGHAMMGLSLGPISGRLMAEILSGEEPSLPIAPLNPDRYA